MVENLIALGIYLAAVFGVFFLASQSSAKSPERSNEYPHDRVKQSLDRMMDIKSSNLIN